jgi:hypothetical protein
MAAKTPPRLKNVVGEIIAVYFSFGQRSIRRGKVRNIYEILMMFLVHQLLCERSSILSPLLILFFPLVPSVVAADSKRDPHILPKTKLGQPGRSARKLLLQIRKTNSMLVQFRGELAA